MPWVWAGGVLHSPASPLLGAFGTLGVGAGFALGAKLCRPDSEVSLVWAGGGGSQWAVTCHPLPSGVVLVRGRSLWLQPY